MSLSDYVDVEVISKDGLVRWEWGFWFDNHTLWLDYYGESTRATRRHKFIVTQSFIRLNPRQSTMPESDVIIPATIQEEAIKKFTEGITVKRWSERK